MAGLTGSQLHRVTIEFHGPRNKRGVKALMEALRAAAPRGVRIRQERIVAVKEDQKAKRGRKRRGT